MALEGSSDRAKIIPRNSKRGTERWMVTRSSGGELEGPARSRRGVRAGREAPLEVLPLLLEPIRGLEGLSTSPLGPVRGVGKGG